MRREMESLPEDVLRQAALEKGPNSCATKRARIAQKILWERLHWPCADAPSQHVDRHVWIQNGGIAKRQGCYHCMERPVQQK